MSFSKCNGSFSPIGVTQNPLTHSIFECNSTEGAVSPPGPARAITTESGILITTESGLDLTTET